MSDDDLVQAILAGDDDAFETLFLRYQNLLVRVALIYVRDHTTAEEVSQETWLAVLENLIQFKRLSSFRTWLFGILRNRAISRAQREGRFIMLELPDEDEPAVSGDRFNPRGHPQFPQHWTVDPADWTSIPEQRVLSAETLALIRAEIDRLPVQQREVMTLRDLELWSSEEVCRLLEITEANQRVLLHRARSKVRQALETYFSES